jgi:hypothetical protein
MGDRGTLTFVEGETQIATLYTHWQGSVLDKVWGEFVAWQERCIAELAKRDDAIRAHRDYARDPDYPAMDSRWGDATYLAARFLTWAVNHGSPGGLDWGIFPTGNWMQGADWQVRCSTGVPEITQI